MKVDIFCYIFDQAQQSLSDIVFLIKGALLLKQHCLGQRKYYWKITMFQRTPPY
jgi:hypothetical protein